MNDQKLSMEQAIANIQNVIANYKGTLGEHAALQSSIKMILEALPKKEDE